MYMDPQFKQQLLETQKQFQIKREQEESLRLQREGRYVYQHTTGEQLFTLKEKSSLTRKKVGVIRDIISANMPEAYETIDDIRQADKVDQRAVELHHSRGRQFVENGAKVLEFDIAGSGFKQFRAIHKGFHGKYMVNERGEKEKFKRQLRATWINRAFSWLPNVRSVEEIEKENAKRAKLAEELKNKYHLDVNLEGMRDEKEANRRLKEAQKRLLDEEYGERQIIGGKRKEHIRKKVTLDQRKTRITMAGPLALWGASNSGDYSIENLRQYMLTMGSDYLRNIFEGWRGPEDAHDINLVIRGHSRGGVAAAEGAMMIKHWVSENYPQYMERVKFDLIQYDPVPGFGSYSKHASVDHGAEVQQKGGVKMKSLGNEANTTVVYSMHTDHSVFFTPQVIQGAKRIILTPFKHSVDLGTADRTQEQAHRRGFVDARNGNIYRGSGINDLERGVYIVDEQNTLIKMDNYMQVERILDTFVGGTKNQKERHNIMKQVAETWFINDYEARVN